MRKNPLYKGAISRRSAKGLYSAGLRKNSKWISIKYGLKLEVEAGLHHDMYVQRRKWRDVRTNFGKIYYTHQLKSARTTLSYNLLVNDVLIYRNRMAIIRENQNLYHIVDLQRHIQTVVGAGDKYKRPEHVIEEEVLPILDKMRFSALLRLPPVFVNNRTQKYKALLSAKPRQRQKIRPGVYVERSRVTGDETFTSYKHEVIDGRRKRIYLGSFLDAKSAIEARKSA